MEYWVCIRVCPGASAGIPATENHKASIKQAMTGVHAGETGWTSQAREIHNTDVFMMHYAMPQSLF